MGADFTFAKFPRFTTNDDRREQFRQAIQSAKPEDMEWLRDDYYWDDESLEEIISDMVKAIEEWQRNRDDLHWRYVLGRFSNTGF